METNRFTQNLMARFPSWMKMAKDPDSIGAQFLDVFGLTYQDFEDELTQVQSDFYIQTDGTEMIDWLYKLPLTSVRVDDAEEIDNVFLKYTDGGMDFVMAAPNLRVFYHRKTQVPVYWIDRAGGYLYLRVNLDLIVDWDHPFESLEINGANHFDLILHPVWNPIDEFGLLVGLKRLPHERNTDFQERILDVFRNPGTVTQSGVRAGIARELGLSFDEVEVRALSDPGFQEELTLPDGTPGKRLMRYAKQVNETLKFTWDTMNFGEAYWFSIEQDNLAIEYLPHVWDADLSGFQKTDFQSGVGYGDDLLVHKPKQENSFREVKVSIGLMGYLEQYEEIYPEITFTYKIYAEGKIIERDYQEQSFRYTIQAGEVFSQDFRIRSDADIEEEIILDLTSATKVASGTNAEELTFGKSTDILHTQTDGLVRLGVQFYKFPDRSTPELKTLGIVWEDTTGKERTFLFQTRNDFLLERNNTSGNPMAKPVYSDIAHGADGLTLGYGAFYSEVDTTEEWKSGQWEINNIRIEKGTVSLNLDRFNITTGPTYA